MKQVTTVNVNKEITLEVVTFNKKFYRAVIRKNGEVINARHRIKDFDLVGEVRDLLAEVISEEIESLGIGHGAKLEDDGQFTVETFTYDVLVAVVFTGNSIEYFLTAVKDDDRDKDDVDKNKVVRKTWKGLINYLNRFDK